MGKAEAAGLLIKSLAVVLPGLPHVLLTSLSLKVAYAQSVVLRRDY